jgi:hypothetical protein
VRRDRASVKELKVLIRLLHNTLEYPDTKAQLYSNRVLLGGKVRRAMAAQKALL